MNPTLTPTPTPTGTAILISRRLLQTAYGNTLDGISDNSLFPTTAPGESILNPINASSSTAVAVRRPFNPSTYFDSSMALTVLVLLTAIFVMGFFSAYIRRFSAEEPSPPSTLTHRNPTFSDKGGLDPTAVNSLPLVSYGKATKHPMIDDCPICLSEFQEREAVKFIPYCSHVFHPRCIDTWLSSHVTCPLCRSTQLFKRVEEECLDVKQDKNDNGVCEMGETSTMGDSDAWRNEL